jgi:hypothetical protein
MLDLPNKADVSHLEQIGEETEWFSFTALRLILLHYSPSWQPLEGCCPWSDVGILNGYASFYCSTGPNACH